MALIKCPECGKENVSDSAVSCPECGFSIKEHFDKIKLEELRIKEQKEYQEKQAAEGTHKARNSTGTAEGHHYTA